MNVIYAAWSVMGIAVIVFAESCWKQKEQWSNRDIGSIGTMARLGIGLWLAGSAAYGQLVTRFVPLHPTKSFVKLPKRRKKRTMLSQENTETKGLSSHA